MNPHRTVFFDTNLNGKLAADHFIHIDLAPAKRIPESVLNGTIIEVKTKDDSHPPILVQVDDLARIPFSQIRNIASCLTWCSHGMHSWDLAEHLKQRHQDITSNTEFAIYFYKKVKP